MEHVEFQSLGRSVGRWEVWSMGVKSDGVEPNLWVA